MENQKTLLVAAKYGSLEFPETAWPYYESAHDEQVETCVKSICKQIADSGKAEMTQAFKFFEDIISE